jgi:hypothetical protein
VASSSAFAEPRPNGRLRDRLVKLAGTPDDDSPAIATDLIVIAQLAADRVEAVSYASVTSKFQSGHATVAASSDLAVAVDQAQYAEDAGPCLDALAGGRPVAVPEIGATMVWPRFREVAVQIGLHASLSIPLFAGRGAPLAALNLYGHRPEPMRTLTAAVSVVYEGAPAPADLEVGAGELIAGLAGAFAVRSVIQQAMGVVMSIMGADADDAHLMLRTRSAKAGVTLAEMAGRVTSGQRW